jgi:Zn-dependent peptidase ImmA (M78 family)/transcriptional regulator with XRE-family HTH domain
VKAQAKPPAASTDFDGTRLTVARRLRGMSKTALAREVSVTASAIAQFEKGANNPSQSVANKIALALGFSRDFFGVGRAITPLPASTAHFRSLRSTTAMAREQALAYGELCLELVDLMEQFVDLPPVDLPALDLPATDTPSELGDDDIRRAAATVRKEWAVGPGPVGSVVQLLEAHGIVVLRLPHDTDPKVDAFSTDAGRRPLVLLSPTKVDKARSRFDSAHELGHLVLHPDTEPGSKLVENQAHAFAAEFLMPRDEIFGQLPRRIDWPVFHDLKRKWGVSLRALVYRAHKLDRLSQASYRRANQQLSIWGFPEPGSLGPAESPKLLGAALELMDANGIDFDEVLAQNRIDHDVSRAVIAGGSENRPHLNLPSAT